MGTGLWKIVREALGTVLKSSIARELAAGATAEMAVAFLRRKYNPDITDAQAAILRGMLASALSSAGRGCGREAAEYLSSAIALAVPNEEEAGVYQNLLTIVFASAPGIVAQVSEARSQQTRSSSSRRSNSSNTTTVDGDASNDGCEEQSLPSAPDMDAQMAVQDKLFDMGISPDATANLPMDAQLSLVDTLSSMDLQCPIAMEPIVEGGRIAPGVVALLKRGESNHVFLFKRYALDQWFAASRSRTNPLSRDSVENGDIFLLSEDR